MRPMPATARRSSPPASAYLVTDILADNTDPAANSLWGPRFQLPADGGRRPATLKTGTTNDFKDLQAYGYLAGNPDDPDDTTGAIVTGVWVGNSDFSAIEDVFAADGPTFIWHDYMAEVAALNELPVYDFHRPDGVTDVTIDAMSGLLPGEHTTTTVVEVVRTDFQPGSTDTTHRELAIEAESGKIWREGCGDFEALPQARLAGSVRLAASARARPPGLPRPRRLGIRPSVMGRGEPRLARASGTTARRSSTPRCACRSPDRSTRRWRRRPNARRASSRPRRRARRPRRLRRPRRARRPTPVLTPTPIPSVTPEPTPTPTPAP